MNATGEMEVRIADLRVAWWRRNIVVGLVFLVVVLLVINGVMLSLALANRASTNAIKKSNAISLCVAVLSADAIGGIGDAFSTPPAPNQSREDAVKIIAQAARKLHQAKTICTKEFK